MARWRAANPERNLANGRRWVSQNKSLVKARQKKWRDANPDKVREHAEKTYLVNREKRRPVTARWAVEHPEKRRIHKQNRRARKLAAGGVLSAGLIDKLFRLQRGKCPCCRLPLGKNFHMDHRIPLAAGGTNTDDNMQLLRSGCNNQKWTKDPIDFMQSKGFLL